MKNEELLRYERMYRVMRERLGTARLLFDHPNAIAPDVSEPRSVPPDPPQDSGLEEGLQPPFDGPAPL